MSDVNLEVYLYFKGQAKAAMEFYKGVFGGELSMQSYAEVPPEALPKGWPEDRKDWLMHATLEGGDVKLMASDTENASDSAKKIDLSIGGKDETHLRQIFEKLGEGGEVHQELAPAFWGDIFGSLTDKFGVNWMVVISRPSGS